MIETQQSFLVTTYKISIALLIFGGIIIAILLIILKERLKIINLIKKDIELKGNDIINFRNIKAILFSHRDHDHSRFIYVFLSQYNKILKSDLQLINF